MSAVYIRKLGNRTCMYVDNCGDDCLNLDAAYTAWEFPGIGRSLTFMAAQGLVCLCIVCLVESDIFGRVVRRISSALRVQRDVERSTLEHGVPLTSLEDSDVAAERQRIDSTPVEQLATTDAVLLRQLTKFYNGSFLAVDRLSVGIPKGE